MTVTDNDPPTALADRGGTGRQPISDVGAYLDELPEQAQAGLHALGELLVGVMKQPARTEPAARSARCLGVADTAHLIGEDRDLEPLSRLTTAVALAEWTAVYSDVIEVGPGQRAQLAAWTQTEIGGQIHLHPQCLRRMVRGARARDAAARIGAVRSASRMGTAEPQTIFIHAPGKEVCGPG